MASSSGSRRGCMILCRSGPSATIQALHRGSGTCRADCLFRRPAVLPSWKLFLPRFANRRNWQYTKGKKVMQAKRKPGTIAQVKTTVVPSRFTNPDKSMPASEGAQPVNKWVDIIGRQGFRRWKEGRHKANCQIR